MAQAKAIEAAAARIDGLALPPSRGWGRAAREKALARLRAMGLPGRRDEYWRFTDPAPFNDSQPPQVPLFDAHGDTPIFGRVARTRLVFVDGIFHPEASDVPDGAGLEIMRLSEAMATDIHWARDLYGTLEAAGQMPVKRPFAALNTAAASDGMVIRVTGKIERPVAFVYLQGAEQGDASLHHLIRVEPGAELTVLESGPGAARFNKCIEVDVAEGGRFHHVRAQGRAPERRAITHVFARMAAQSVLKSFTMTVNGRMTRNEFVIDFQGDNAVAHVAGAALGEAGFHHDDTVFVTHDALACESRQVFKKVLRNGATGVFQGKILVREGAQKTDGYQKSQALLLDGDSQFLAKPELEIYADDVACSHGSTTGALDEGALFYLRSRGVPRDEAADLLVLAFLAEAIDEIDSDIIRGELLNRLESWLVGQRG